MPTVQVVFVRHSPLVAPNKDKAVVSPETFRSVCPTSGRHTRMLPCVACCSNQTGARLSGGDSFATAPLNPRTTPGTTTAPASHM